MTLSKKQTASAQDYLAVSALAEGFDDCRFLHFEGEWEASSRKGSVALAKERLLDREALAKLVKPMKDGTPSARDFASLLASLLEATPGFMAQSRNSSLELEVNLRATYDPNSPEKVHFDPPLVEQLANQWEEFQAQKDRLTVGHVYCYRCGFCPCDHSKPAEPDEVFIGYDQLGKPLWKTLGQLLLDQKHERVDCLFGPAAQLLTLTIAGTALRDRQLATFGRASKTFRVLGEVVVGYFSLDSCAIPKLALSIMVVEGRGEAGAPILQLNTLFPKGFNDEHQEIFQQNYPWVFRALKRSKDKLGQLQNAILDHHRAKDRSAVNRDKGKIFHLLKQLAQNLEQGARQARRRTRHAHDRSQQQRPVHMAMADLRHCKPERLFWDRKSKAIMVCGARGRCHAFSEEGRLITSFFMTQEAIQGRLRKHRWARMESDRAISFLQGFADSDTPPPQEG